MGGHQDEEHDGKERRAARETVDLLRAQDPHQIRRRTRHEQLDRIRDQNSRGTGQEEEKGGQPPSPYERNQNRQGRQEPDQVAGAHREKVAKPPENDRWSNRVRRRSPGSGPEPRAAHASADPAITSTARITTDILPAGAFIFPRPTAHPESIPHLHQGPARDGHHAGGYTEQQSEAAPRDVHTGGSPDGGEARRKPPRDKHHEHGHKRRPQRAELATRTAPAGPSLAASAPTSSAQRSQARRSPLTAQRWFDDPPHPSPTRARTQPPSTRYRSEQPSTPARSGR